MAGQVKGVILTLLQRGTSRLFTFLLSRMMQMKAKGFPRLPSQARRTFGKESEARGCGRLKTDSHFVGRLSLGDLQIVLKCSNFPDLGVLCC